MTEKPKVIKQKQFTNREVVSVGAKVGLIVLVLFFFMKFGAGLYQDYQRVEVMGAYFDANPWIPGDGIRPHVEPLNVFIRTIFITFIVGLFTFPGGMIGVSLFRIITNSRKVILLGGLIGASLGAFLGYYLLSLYLLWMNWGT